ncbi:hypothetical protein D1007_20743 [Hordeum vulgare]|nr:hypothetical protein D1007_20743 [Hordeum vulgare]
MVAEAAEAEAARNRSPPVPQLRTQAEQMAFLVSIVKVMEKNIQEIMQNQKSLERVVETKFHNMDIGALETRVPCAPDLCTGTSNAPGNSTRGRLAGRKTKTH